MNNLFKYLVIVFLLFPLLGVVYTQTVSYQYTWTKYYVANEGKIIGVWPHNNRYTEISKLKELKYRWGFNFLVFYSGYNLAKFQMAREVFPPDENIMMQILFEDYGRTAMFDSCWAYYLDEPADRNYGFNSVQLIKNWYSAAYPNSPFVISGYKRNSNLINFTNAFADKTTFSAYKHWWELLFWWVSCCPENPDQRSDWTDMQNLFGSKFTTTWISSQFDQAEYPQLLGHAKNLGLEGVWLYALEPYDNEADDVNLESFSNAAANNNFLTAFYRQARDIYIDENFSLRQYVGPSYESFIPANYDHSVMNFPDYEVTNNRIEDYFAGQRIVAGGENYFIIPPSKSASFNSDFEIVLKPGFHSQPGSEFRAYINKVVKE